MRSCAENQPVFEALQPLGRRVRISDARFVDDFSDDKAASGRSVHGRANTMLALTRRVGEEIVIGDPRKPLGFIRVVEIHGDKVKLSFDFPREMQINRRELADQKARQDPNAPPPPPRNNGSRDPHPGNDASRPSIGNAPRHPDNSASPHPTPPTQNSATPPAPAPQTEQP